MTQKQSAVIGSLLVILILFGIGAAAWLGSQVRVTVTTEFVHVESRIADALRDGAPIEVFVKLLDDHPELATMLDHSGGTPLHDAAMYGRADVIRLLIEHGAGKQVNHPLGALVPGATPLHFAASKGDNDSVRVLLQVGGDPTARTVDGDTAADFAAGRGHGELAAFLRAVARDAEAQDVQNSR